MTPSEPAPTPTNRRALGCLFEIVETVVLTLVLFFVIQTFVAQPFQVKQVSMRNTIQDGQYVLVDRLTPRFNGYHRGDIIVFTPPADGNAETGTNEPFIKRVIGVADDVIAIHDGKVFVNGIELVEPYLFAVNGVAQPTVATGDTDTWTVPAGQLFVMGDHRAESTDSRIFGTISVDKVIGRAWIRYWPLENLGVLPTAQHPELVVPSASPSAGPSTGPSTRVTPKPTARPTKRPTASPHR